MGVHIYANNSPYSLDMAYSSFSRVRQKVALLLDEEFGNNYSNLRKCYSKYDYEEHDKVANRLLREKNLDEDIVDFLYQSDCDGKIAYKTCKKLLDLVGDTEFVTCYMGFYDESKAHDFQKILQDCYSHRRSLRWD